jgi:chemosensory pili system protein ChpA (sensor histidine kinase/response regulator)
METNFNLGSLKIVQAPLAEYFKSATDNIENNLKLVRDEKKIPTNHDAIDLLVKIQKTLEMIGLRGISKVLSLTEEGLKSVREVKFDSKKNVEILEISLHILKNSTVYIQRLVNSGMDQPTKFYADYAKLCSLLGKEAQIKDLFFPKFDLTSDVNEQMQNDLRTGIFINDSSKKNLLLHLEKVQSTINQQMPTILSTMESYGEFYSEEEKISYQNVCKNLYDTFDYAQKLKINKNYYILFAIYKLYICILSPVFNSKFINYVENRKSFIQSSLENIEVVVSKLIGNIKGMDLGEKTGNVRVDEENIKEILFELIYSLKLNEELKNMPVYKELEAFFDVDYYVDQLNEVGVSNAIVIVEEAQMDEIEKQFLDMKEGFHLLSSKAIGAEDYNQNLDRLYAQSRKLQDLISFDNEISKLVISMSFVIEALKTREVNFDAMQKEISLSLVLLDYAINNFLRNSVDNRLRKDFSKQINLQASRLGAVAENDLKRLELIEMPKLDSISQKADEKKTFSKIFEQLATDLTKIEETLDYFLRNEGENANEISTIYKPLVGMKGIFSIIGKSELGVIVEKVSEPWKKIIESGIDSVSREKLSESIAMVSGLSLLVRAFMKENETEAEEIQEKIMKLFYKNNMDVLNQESFVPEYVTGETKVEQQVDTTPEKEEKVIEDEVFDFNFNIPVEVDTSVVVDSLPIEKEEVVVNSHIEFERKEVAPINAIYTESTNDPDIAEVFLEEATEVLGNLNQSFPILEANLDNKEELTNVRRYFHTLKGSGRMVGLEFMGEAAWMVEQTLNRCLSGELEFNEYVLNTVKELKDKFEVWVAELKITNEVTVDLVAIKIKMLGINPNLTNHVEIIITKDEDLSSSVTLDVFSEIEELPSDSKLDNVSNVESKVEVMGDISKNIEVSEDSFEFKFDIPEEVQAEDSLIEKEDGLLVDDLNDLILKSEIQEEIIIEGKSISKSLYNLFNEESNIHIEQLKLAAHEEYNEPVVLNEEFMRHAHTLSSIAASVNMSKISKIAGRLEDIVVLTIERGLALSQLQMNAVRHVVDNFDLFKELDNGKHLSYYDSLLENLDDLYEKLHQEEVVEIAVQEQISIDNSFVESKSEEIKENYGQSVDVDKLREQFVSEVTLLVDAQREEIMKNVAESDSVNKNNIEDINSKEEETRKVVANLRSKVEELEDKINRLNQDQKDKEQLFNKALEVTKNDIRTLAHIIKKKYELANKEVLSETIGEISEVKTSDLLFNLEGEDIGEPITYKEVVDELVNMANQIEEVSEEENNEVNALLEKIDSNEVVKVGSILESVAETESSSEDIKIMEILEENSFIVNIFEEKISNVEDEIDPDIYEISKEEAEDMFENINELIEKNNNTGLTGEENKSLKRYLHTFKGSVRMAGANKLGMLAHRLESLLDYVESRKINMKKIGVILEKEFNKISSLMKNPSMEMDEAKSAWLDNLIHKSVKVNKVVAVNKEISVVDSNEEVKVVEQVKKKENKQYIKVLSDIVDSAINDAGEVRLSKSTLEDNSINTKKSIVELKGSSIKLLKMVKEVEVQAESQIQSHADQLTESSSNFDPLEFDRFTRLQELTRLMNEAVADIQETVDNLQGTSKIQDNTINSQSIITNNLLAQLLKVRLVTVESVSDRFYKITRNTAKELNKRVLLEISGETTEIDKLVLDKIISPIEHILRNSIVHGIEGTEERLLKGKQGVGKIKIEVMLDGNFTVVKITDDGSGINVDKVRDLAIKRGLIHKDKTYSRDELINLIFQSGFTTADNVSQVAGRGVGMDVVKNEVLSIGGSVKIETEKDKGTQFILTLPMEVATSQSLLCLTKDKLIAIPAILIDEIASIKEAQIKKAYEDGKLNMDGVDYPLYSASHLLGIIDSSVSPTIKTYNNIVRIKYMNEIIVVHVDKILSTTEILIKSLGSIYSKFTGVLGVTVLGDGRQGLVINPIQILSHYKKEVKSITTISSVNEEVVVTQSRITVMVVDDSITVRRASSKILERNNYNVVLAKDGEDALEQLQVVTPDIILSDIEMPRMDGFEFVKNVRSMNKYDNVPIIMITSRTADKHQKHAFSLGANDFLGKPYKEEELISKIELLLENIKLKV